MDCTFIFYFKLKMAHKVVDFTAVRIFHKPIHYCSFWDEMEAKLEHMEKNLGKMGEPRAANNGRSTDNVRSKIGFVRSNP